MPFSIDSNSSQAYYGEETALGLQSQGPYTPLEINSYSDQGVDTKQCNVRHSISHVSSPKAQRPKRMSLRDFSQTLRSPTLHV